ncbi:hypothetical protein M569_16165, partial [Genlisea aurea]
HQSISGGQSFAEILFGSADDKHSLLIRGSSLHKMIRLISFTISGPAYLNFMGNEFGHPKRVEFPSASNDFCYELAGRNWKLLDDRFHRGLFAFDKDMLKLDSDGILFQRGSAYRHAVVHHVDDSSMAICYLRGPFVFVFNFHPENSYEGYCLGVEEAGQYEMILNSDERVYGGEGLVDGDDYILRSVNRKCDGKRFCLELPLLPSRTAQVYKLTRILR